MTSFNGINLKTLEFKVQVGTELQFNNIKLIKFNSDIQPKILVKKSIFDINDIPSWNNRQIIIFNFEDYFPNQTGIGKVIAQYTSDTINLSDKFIDFSQYSVFNILKIKNVGSSEVFKNIQQEIASYDSTGSVNGVQLENINVNDNSFDAINNFYINKLKNDVNNYIMFGFKCTTNKSILFDTLESNNVEHEFRNMIYIYNNDFITGFSNSLIKTNITFQLLLPNIKSIEILNLTPSENYSLLIDENNITTIPENDTSIHTLLINPIEGIVNSKINLRFISDDILFNTFVPIFKTVGTNQYLLSSQPSGLDPTLYIFNISFFKISAVDKVTRSTTSVLSIGGTRDIEFFVIPDIKEEYFGGINPYSPLIIEVINVNPGIFKVDESIRFPDISENEIKNSILTIESTSNPSNLNNELIIEFRINSSIDIFATLEIPSISVQVANIFLNEEKCFVNTADIIKYNPNIIIDAAPGTIEDLSKANFIGVNQQADITPLSYNFNVEVIDDEFLITYITNLQVDDIILRFNGVDTSFNAYEGDIYIFDTSHISNVNHMMTFFINSNIISNNELLSEYVTYNEYINQGNPGSSITLKIPPYSEYSKIYISDHPSGLNMNNKLNGICVINILPNPENLSIGTVNFSELNNNGSSILSLVPDTGDDGVPIQAINIVDVVLNNVTTDAARIIDLFSGETTPLPQITINSVYLSKPNNIVFTVFNKNYVKLTWKLNNRDTYQFSNPRESRFVTEVYYNIYREDVDTDNIAILGTNVINEFVDRTAVNFNNYNYYIESVATWEGLTITSQLSDPLFVFVCESNRFPDGRWNNSFSNPKLYKELTSCSNSTTNITTNLFPNSWSLSKKQTYARLSKLAINKR
jgi:hypothetical protein